MNILCENINERIPQGIRKLNKEENIYLYGMGKYADDMLSILNKYHIRIEGILVSKGYMSVDAYRDISVKLYDESDKEEYVIVAGFNVLYHKDLTNRLIFAQNVKRVYVLNGQDVYWNNHCSFMDPKIYLIDNYYETLLKRGLDFNYYNQHINLFDETYNWLEDQLSQSVMEAYLEGHIKFDNFPMKKFWKREDLDNQYFPKDLIKLGEHEVFVDCGAYSGDTFESFRHRVKSFDKYYALEPDKRMFSMLRQKICAEINVVHIPLGAWSERSVLSFAHSDGCCGTVLQIEEGESIENIEVDAIDNIVSMNENVTFIKMDIEGSELNALIGAEKTIERCKPILAICVYHKKEDLITIPQYIKSISKKYKLYLRPHVAYAGEVVLYGIHC